MKQNCCGLIWINPGMQNFEKNKKNKKNKDLATSPDIRVVVETLFFLFFLFFWFAPVERKKSRVNPRIFAGLSTAKTTILQFGLDDCAVRVGGFCSSG
jgi:hypothetical protein